MPRNMTDDEYYEHVLSVRKNNFIMLIETIVQKLKGQAESTA
jgi:hypothetical protein